MVKIKNILAIGIGILVFFMSSYLGGMNAPVLGNPFFFLVTSFVVIGGSITAMGIYGLIKEE